MRRRSFGPGPCACPSRSPADPNPNYRKLASGPGGMHIEVQKVDHPSRVHRDIESTNLEAEVRRLEGLGAKQLNRVEDGW
jgi:hypothetical protein